MILNFATTINCKTELEILYSTDFLEHDTGMHPENKKRLAAFSNLSETEALYDESLLSLIHCDDYIKRVKEASRYSKILDTDTVTCPKSFRTAVKAVGMTIQAIENNDFALVRPPGHHAYPDRSSGFCIFNNIAIATKTLLNQGKRILIFDFDGHLGDGTSRIFYHTDKVVYWSFHQYPAFPGHGTVDEFGDGSGKGYTLNIPLPPGSGDDIFMDAFRTFLPVVKQFNPDVVAVSAGFDAHQYDLLLDLRLTANTFYEIGKQLSENFMNIFATLEGGYNVEELPKCVSNFIDGINGKEIKYNEHHTDSELIYWQEYEIRIDKLLDHLKPYWNI